MSYKQPIDNKRDQFRKYIESKGVIDTISKVLIKLLEAPVKPEHPMDFIRDNLGPTIAEKRRIEGLEQQVIDYKQEVSDLKLLIDELKVKLDETNKTISNDSTENKTEVKLADESADTATPPDTKTPECNETKNDSEQKPSTDKANVESEAVTTSVVQTNGENIDKIDATSAKIDNTVTEPVSNGHDSIKDKSGETADAVAENIETKN